MKKFLSILLTAALAVSTSVLGGCSTSEAETNAANTSNTTAGGSTNAKAIDLKEAVKIVLGGYNGSGYAEVTIDNGKMKDLLDDEDANTSFALIGSLDIAKIDNNGNLSNGDIIKIKVKYSSSLFEKANLTAANSEFEYEISGLEEKEKLDLFKDVEIVATPAYDDNTKYTLSARYTGDDEFVRQRLGAALVITGENGNVSKGFKSDYFSGGEKVTVSIAEDKIEDLSYWYDVLETSKEYTVTVE